MAEQAANTSKQSKQAESSLLTSPTLGLDFDDAELAKLTATNTIMRNARALAASEREKLLNSIESSLASIETGLEALQAGVDETYETEQMGGHWCHYKGIALTGDISVTYYYSTWSDSDGSGSQPPRFHVETPEGKIEIERCDNVAREENPINLSVAGERLLEARTSIGEDIPLPELGRIAQRITWLKDIVTELTIRKEALS